MALASPEEWFLSKENVKRVPAYTDENEVTALVDGKEYMDHLNDKIIHMTKGDYLFISAWRVTPTMSLTPDVSSSPSFWQQVEQLILKKVSVKAIIWFLPNMPFIDKVIKEQPLLFKKIQVLVNKGNVEFATNIYNTVQGSNSGSDFILDSRLNRYGPSSHHQKYIILRSQNTHWAYVGGIDLAVDRWDTAAHDNPKHRPREFMDGWHDIQCSIKGNAVAQLYEDFKQRWNERKDGNMMNIPPSHPIPKPINDVLNTNASFGKQYVQILRTLVCGNVYEFEPRGSQTVRLAYEKAINNAKYYIYIEDQYFWPSTLIELLCQAAARNVKIILVLAKTFDMPDPFATVHYEMRWDDCIKKIMRANPNSIYPFHLELKKTNDQIYVHSKLLIIDDCYAAIGSANQSYRSHTNDSEMHVAIVDADTVEGTMGGKKVKVCKFALELRLKLWSEHLGISVSELQDPILAIEKFPDRRKSSAANPAKVHHTVCNYKPPPLATLSDYLKALIILQEYISVKVPGYTELKKIINLFEKIKPFVENLDAVYKIFENNQEIAIDNFINANTSLSTDKKEFLKLLLKAVRLLILTNGVYMLIKQFIKIGVLNVRTTC